MEEDKQEPTLKEILQKISENLPEAQEKKKAKKFFMPFKARVGRAAAKKGYVTVCFIDENRNVNLFKTQVDEGVLQDNKGIPHIATTEYMLHYKNRPFLIVPAWDTHPFSPWESYRKAEEKKTLTTGWKLLANHLETTSIKPKKSFGAGAWIIGILVIGAIGYYLFKGGI